MQFSEHWLHQFVNPKLDADELGHALTMAGLEVEDQKLAALLFNNVVVGEIISAEKHPDADRLQLCKVDVGQDKPLQIVCGAPNARVGLKAPCAMVGAKLADFKIKRAKVRGIESLGMMCSAKELGLAEEADGLLEFPASATIGQDVREYLDLDDTLYTIKLTPNRADCLSILGVARDVVAITGAPLTLPAINEASVTTDKTQIVKVNQSAACPSYFGRVVEGVNAKVATPDWMVRRLERSGLRSITVIVDITNYVLLELGQPMHAFDLAKISGDINVRFAQKDEQIKLLNDTEAKLVADDLVIADDSGPIALAGIMGDKPTSVTDESNSIFLEAAFFTRDVMAGKARRHGLSTDSSYRFERGVDYGNTKQALERATGLVLDICGGQAGAITEAVATLPERKAVTLRYARVLSVLGIDISKVETGTLLTQLGFSFTESDDSFVVQAPTYRFDIEREADLIEEVARLHGYDKIPAIAPVANLNMLPLPAATLSMSWLKDSMQSQGYQEVVTYSFVEGSWERDLLANANPITLKNPIASNLSTMRSGLWGGLLDVLTYNLNRKQERAMVFEVGSTFHHADKAQVKSGDNAYREETHVAGLCYGASLPEQWSENERDFDFYDVKALVEMLTHGQAEYRQETHSALHPGQSARVYLQGEAIGWIGKLHPKWQQKYDLPKSATLFELEVRLLLSTALPVYEEVSKFIAVRRDIAVVVDDSVEAGAIIDAVVAAKISLLQKIQLFDIYQGKGIEGGKKSLAFLILIQDTHKTIVDSEAEAALAELLKLLEDKFCAQLRN
ncbi:MAG: phenylalanine--tRNA ligase subunit beta [Methylophilaceae bacterium]|nr:phenylalanine--tRNA ligase subunit beta [Methylophilaceae bacterium]